MSARGMNPLLTSSSRLSLSPDPALLGLQQPLQHLPEILLAGYGGGPALGMPPRVDTDPLVDESYNLHVTTYHEGLWACMAANEVSACTDFWNVPPLNPFRNMSIVFLSLFMARLLPRKSRSVD